MHGGRERGRIEKRRGRGQKRGREEERGEKRGRVESPHLCVTVATWLELALKRGRLRGVYTSRSAQRSSTATAV